jgi:hypothetical protein
MGYSVRTFGWRYTAWVMFNTTTFTADWSAANHTPPDRRHDAQMVGEVEPSSGVWWGAASGSFNPLAVELYDHRRQDSEQPLRFDFDDDGEVKNLINSTDREVLAAKAQLHAMLVTQFSYPQEWLEQRRQKFQKGQIAYDKHMGFAPY